MNPQGAFSSELVLHISFFNLVNEYRELCVTFQSKLTRFFNDEGKTCANEQNVYFGKKLIFYFVFNFFVPRANDAVSFPTASS